MKPLLVFLLILSCGFVSLAQTPRITFQAARFYPEGIAYNAKDDIFYTGSVKTGTIAKVTSNGQFTEWYKDPTLKSSFGMKIDSTRNMLWVCTGDPNYSIHSDSTTFKKIIRLIALDLSSGKKVKDYNLSGLFEGKHFPNDLTLDREGNIYMTDSYSPVIYKVDVSGKGTVFAESPFFKALEIGLNGIAWHPDGFLLVVNNGTGALYKVMINDPKNIQQVNVKTFFPGGDGLVVDRDGKLILVQNKGVNKIFMLSSKDKWGTAEIESSTQSEDRFQQPSTCVIKRGRVYVMNSKLNEIADKSITPSNEFSIQVAEFKPVK